MVTSLNRNLKSHTTLKNTLDSIHSDIELISYSLNSILNGLEKDDDHKLISEMLDLHAQVTDELNQISFRQLFKGQDDQANAYIDIQSGSGGTEAQDWVAMIMRMYLKWAEKHSFVAQITESNEG